MSLNCAGVQICVKVKTPEDRVCRNREGAILPKEQSFCTMSSNGGVDSQRLAFIEAMTKFANSYYFNACVHELQNTIPIEVNTMAILVMPGES